MGSCNSDEIGGRFPGSRREVTLNALTGIRRVDVLTESGIDIESKVGRTYLTKRTRQQIARDVELLKQNEDVMAVAWQFTTSPLTSRGGPSAALASELDNAGIPWSVR